MRRRSAAFMGGPNPTLQKKSETRTSLTPFALQLLGDNANNDNSISNNNNNYEGKSSINDNNNNINNNAAKKQRTFILSAGAHGEQGYRRTMEDEHVMELYLNTTGLNKQPCKFFGVWLHEDDPSSLVLNNDGLAYSLNFWDDRDGESGDYRWTDPNTPDRIRDTIRWWTKDDGEILCFQPPDEETLCFPVELSSN